MALGSPLGLGRAFTSCGGAWFELHRLRKDLGEIKPNVQKVLVLEQRLNGHEGWIRSIEERVNHGGD